MTKEDIELQIEEESNNQGISLNDLERRVVVQGIHYLYRKEKTAKTAISHCIKHIKKQRQRPACYPTFKDEWD